MKNNTYIKIVSSGIANHIEELMPFIPSEEIIPLEDGESVEVRGSVFNEGNIIIFRNRQRDVQKVIHTPHTVYVQELNKTISTHRPYSSFLFAMGENGVASLESLLGNTAIPISNEFYLTASPELQEIAAYVTAVLDQITPAVIDRAIEFDRFNLPCRNNVGLEPAFSCLNDALEEMVGHTLLPVKSGQGRNAIDYFYLEPVRRTLTITLDKEEIDPVGKAKEFLDIAQSTWPCDPDTKLPVDPNTKRGKELLRTVRHLLPNSYGQELDTAPKTDLNVEGQR